jgi:protein-S-isoprenylcysteine O-methyltransferase Ste14
MNDKTRSRIYVGIQFALLLALIIYPDDATGWASQNKLFEVAGTVLVLIGFAIEFASGRALGRSLTPSPIPRDSSELVTAGIYKYLRHPIYTGLMVFGLGATLQSGPTPHVWFLVALVILLNIKARWEERLLLARYPEYKAYMSSTPRFLPRLKG